MFKHLDLDSLTFLPFNGSTETLPVLFKVSVTNHSNFASNETNVQFK